MASGGQVLVKTLHDLGVERIFCVAGESYLPVLDALLDYPDIEVVTCRHESGATFMADAYANLTGKPGVAFVTRGPGACNGAIGLHAAKQASSPVILFVGLIHTDDVGKEAFQEFDLPQMFGSLSKRAAVIERAGDIAGAVVDGFSLALSGRCGPVVFGLPEDVLVAQVAQGEAVSVQISSPVVQAQDVSALAELLSAAENPLLIVGGYGWSDEDCRALEKFASESGLPVAASFRRQDLFDHGHDCYVGELGFGSNPALLVYVKEADLVIALGARVSDVMSQGYTLFEAGQKLVHIYPDAEVFGKGYKTDLGIEAYPWDVVQALSGRIEPRWDNWRMRVRAAFESWTSDQAPQNWQGADMTQVFMQLRGLLPEDAIVIGDAGNFSGWCSRYLRYGRPGRQLAPHSGSMGYAVPSAVSAAITCPDRLVIGICGDGGFMMGAQEIATAMHHGAKPIILVCNNNMYGTIRMYQEKDFPGRQSATGLTNPDFMKLAESYGAFGARVQRAEEFETAWQGALDSGRAALIEIVMDPAQVSTVSEV